MSEQLTPPRVGAAWPGQGGVYAGVIRGAEGQPDRHLILADAEGVDLEWGRYGTKTDGADSDVDGAANTKTLLASGEHPAAEFAANHSADGHADFYLPARDEMRLIYVNARAGLAIDDWYWTSTQGDARSAWAQNFGNGYQFWSSRDGQLRVRPVRSIQAQ